MIEPRTKQKPKNEQNFVWIKIEKLHRKKKHETNQTWKIYRNKRRNKFNELRAQFCMDSRLADTFSILIAFHEKLEDDMKDKYEERN